MSPRCGCRHHLKRFDLLIRWVFLNPRQTNWFQKLGCAAQSTIACKSCTQQLCVSFSESFNATLARISTVKLWLLGTRLKPLQGSFFAPIKFEWDLGSPICPINDALLRVGVENTKSLPRTRVFQRGEAKTVRPGSCIVQVPELKDETILCIAGSDRRNPVPCNVRTESDWKWNGFLMGHSSPIHYRGGDCGGTNISGLIGTLIFRFSMSTTNRTYRKVS